MKPNFLFLFLFLLTASTVICCPFRATAQQNPHSVRRLNVSYKNGPGKRIQVKTNKNVELFGLMMQLDMGEDLINSTDTVIIENKKATWRDWYAMSFKNYLRYRAFDSCEMMNMFRNLVTKGYYNDFFISFLLQVDEVPYANINANTDRGIIMPFSKKGDFEEAKNNAEEFLNSFNNFYHQLHFDSYLKEHAAYYNMIKADVEKNLPDPRLLPLMEKFYNKHFNAYYLIPSLNIPTSMGFGKTNNSTQSIFNAFGPFSFQSFDKAHLTVGFDYPAKIEGLSVHEFGHSFVNPAIDKVPEELIKLTEHLYTPIKKEMSKLAYTSWTMCLYEHFVKAGEIMIARKLGNNKEAEKILQDNIKSKFIYLPAIVKDLEKFDKNKSINNSYDDIVPVIIMNLENQYKAEESTR